MGLRGASDGSDDEFFDAAEDIASRSLSHSGTLDSQGSSWSMYDDATEELPFPGAYFNQNRISRLLSLWALHVVVNTTSPSTTVHSITIISPRLSFLFNLICGTSF